MIYSIFIVNTILNKSQKLMIFYSKQIYLSTNISILNQKIEHKMLNLLLICSSLSCSSSSSFLLSSLIMSPFIFLMSFNANSISLCSTVFLIFESSLVFISCIMVWNCSLCFILLRSIFLLIPLRLSMFLLLLYLIRREYFLAFSNPFLRSIWNKNVSRTFQLITIKAIPLCKSLNLFT